MQRIEAVPVQATEARGAVRRRGLLREVLRHWPEYLCVAPFFVLFGVFFAYPIGWALVLSFQRWDGVTDARWVGLDNYRFVLRDPVTRQMFETTARNLVVLVPLGVLLPMVCGVVLNQPGLRLRGLFRTILFVPVVCSLVVVGIIWKLLFAGANGWLNGLLAEVGLTQHDWLKDPTLANVPIWSLTVWGSLGFATLIVLGGLQAIGDDLYDAAKVDGANAWQTFWGITVPLMRPVMLFLLITSTIGVMTLFGQPYVVTGGARIGDASALSFILTAAMLLVVFVQFRLARRWNEA